MDIFIMIHKKDNKRENKFLNAYKWFEMSVNISKRSRSIEHDNFRYT